MFYQCYFFSVFVLFFAGPLKALIGLNGLFFSWLLSLMSQLIYSSSECPLGKMAKPHTIGWSSAPAERLPLRWITALLAFSRYYRPPMSSSTGLTCFSLPSHEHLLVTFPACWGHHTMICSHHLEFCNLNPFTFHFKLYSKKKTLKKMFPGTRH